MLACSKLSGLVVVSPYGWGVQSEIVLLAVKYLGTCPGGSFTVSAVRLRAIVRGLGIVLDCLVERGPEERGPHLEMMTLWSVLAVPLAPSVLLVLGA